MPGPRSNKAPYFSGRLDDLLSDFIMEYKALATACNLTSMGKVETSIRYVPFDMREFWRTLDGYRAGSWTTLKTNLESLYPDTSAVTCITKKTLQDFVDTAAKDCIRDEDDIIAYHHQFLEISNHLYNARELSEEDQNSEFFQGFHPDDREGLANWLFSINPRHPTDKPYAFKDVFTTAKNYFANKQFYWPAHHRLRNNQDEDYHATPNYRIRQRTNEQDPRRHRQDCHIDLSNHNQSLPHRPEYETRTVRLADQDPRQVQEEEDKELSEIITKMVSLSPRDPAYTVLYAQCKRQFPDVAKNLTALDLFKGPATATYQTSTAQQWTIPPPLEQVPPPTRQPWPWHTDQQPTTELSTFFVK